MAVSSAAPGGAVQSRSRPAFFAGGLRYDWLATFFAAWLILGAFLDAWAHSHDQAESFFSPWHGVLYSGYLALAVFLIATYAAGTRRATSWREAMPVGYDLALAGALVFGLGGFGDMAWHLTFGIEKSVEAALSPSHLLLGLGAVLMVTGPLRAAWARGAGRREVTLSALLPAVLGLCFGISFLSFFTAYAHPFVDARASQVPVAGTDLGSLIPGLGVASVLIQSAMLMGAALLLVHRWAPPFGTFTVLFGLNAALMSFFQDEYRWIAVALAAGLAADLLARQLAPAPERRRALRSFAVAVPVVYFALYFAVLMAQDQLAWSVHLWTGAVVLAGFVGYGLSLLLVPPGAPSEAAPVVDMR